MENVAEKCWVEAKMPQILDMKMKRGMNAIILNGIKRLRFLIERALG